MVESSSHVAIIAFGTLLRLPALVAKKYLSLETILRPTLLRSRPLLHLDLVGSAFGELFSKQKFYARHERAKLKPS